MTDAALYDGPHLSRWCFLLALLLMVAPAPAQELPLDTTSAVSPRLPSEDVRSAYLDDPRFQYMPDDGPEEASLWAHFKAWLRSFLRDLGETTGDVLNTGILIGSAVLVAVLIIQVLFMRTRLPWHASESGDEEAEALELGEHGVPDYRARADAARRGGDLRHAVRWLHRALLHELAERGLITYHPDETNGAFVRAVRERASTALAEEVVRATRQFEYIWYGGFEATEREVSALEAAIDRVRTSPRNAS